jgi:hypothetical protein
VIFGGKQLWPATIDLKSLNGKNGFVISGGYLVRKAGDVNGDGIADILFGASGTYTGNKVYVLFGSEQLWPALVDLTTVDGNNGTVFNGISGDDKCGILLMEPEMLMVIELMMLLLEHGERIFKLVKVMSSLVLKKNG